MKQRPLPFQCGKSNLAGGQGDAIQICEWLALTQLRSIAKAECEVCLAKIHRSEIVLLRNLDKLARVGSLFRTP